MTKEHEVDTTAMNENDEEWARNTYVPDAEPSDSAGAGIGDGEDGDDQEEDTLPPGAQPAPSPDASNGAEAPGDEDTLIGLSEQVPADDGISPVGLPDVTPASSADTLIKRAVSTPADPARSPAQEAILGPSSPTLTATVVPKRKASGDWKWLALGAIGVVLLLGLLAGLLTLAYVVGPIQPPRPTLMFDIFPSMAPPESKTSTPRATPTSPPARTLTVPLVVPTHTGSPAPVPRSTPTLLLPTPSQPGDTPGPTSTLTCTDDLRFVTDVTVPDDTTFSPGERFDKTWRVRNNGNCPWATTYRWKLLSGDRMGASGSQEMALIAPGDTADITVALVAPGTPGPYKGVWQMVSDTGEPFGQKLTVVIQVSAPVGEDGYELKPVD